MQKNNNQHIISLKNIFNALKRKCERHILREIIEMLIEINNYQFRTLPLYAFFPIGKIVPMGLCVPNDLKQIVWFTMQRMYLLKNKGILSHIAL